MRNNITYFLFALLICNQINSFELLTCYDGSTSLNDFVTCLQKNIDHFLIKRIHVFYKNPGNNLPVIFQDEKVVIIPSTATPYFSKIMAYANALSNQRVIIAKPNTYFDDTLYQLNYYPMQNQFLGLNNSSNYSCWIFEAPSLVKIPKQIKFTDANIDIIIANSALNTPGTTALNPSLDVTSHQINNKINTHPANLTPNHLNQFKLTWDLIQNGGKILLYARNMHCTNPSYCTPSQNPNCYKFACLSLNKNNSTHILHDLINPIPLPDNSVDVYQSEDVFEHLPLNQLPAIINEIYRVLKPGGFLRLSMPDYRCDILKNRSLKDVNGNIIFDPLGGGQFVNGQVINGGHLWFPTFETTTDLINQTNFFNYGTVNFLHYYNSQNQSITKPINYSVCYVRRTPDHDGRVQNPYRVMSIVVDLVK